MSQNQIVCRVKPYIQPFERRLALAELASLSGAEPQPLPGASGEPLCYEVSTSVSTDVLVEKLAYWESVDNDAPQPTQQALREATVNVVRNSIPVDQIAWAVKFNLPRLIPNRRCLRYGTHGLHEYRGKFFPQLVHALINTAKVPANGLVADPMSGSGTTLVEAMLAGCQGIGLDMNPLSVFMARTKCALLLIHPDELMRTYQDVRRYLLEAETVPSSQGHFASLPLVDQTYLHGWFSAQVLADLDRIMGAIDSLSTGTINDFLRLVVSNILRRVSWQKESDLRVRKEIKTDADIDPIREFLEELGRSVRTVLAFLHHIQGLPLGTFTIQPGDAREIANQWTDYLGQVDVVITSPPYATALPYLDTDRLSLCYLGLLSRPEHRHRDHLMIGNREVTEGKRQDYWRIFQQNKSLLPASVTQLIEQIDHLNTQKDVGFRRRNLPALLARYFFDMRLVLAGVAQLLKPGAPAYFVVGDNHTIAGGQRVGISTSRLLVDIAMSVGLTAEEHIPMEMLVSREIFKNNAVASEMILVLRRPT